MTRTFTLQSASAPSFQLDLEHDLNEAQRAAVTCGNGPKLVIAGAGSGKTRTITYRVAHLMSRGVAPSQILLATFTNKAAREMLSRVEALTGTNVGALWGGTFHAIGNRILRQHAQPVGLQNNYSILDEEDSRDLIKVCVTDAKVKVEEKRFPSPAILHDLVSFAFNTRTPLAEVIDARTPHSSKGTSEREGAPPRYEAKKRAINALDYDDLLRFWLRLVSDHAALVEQLGQQFRYVLVDEYQDTNVIQADIVERLAAHNGRNLMVVGDDAQSIYQFRGANYDNILSFGARNPGTEIFKLEANYRSTPEILEFTNASIANNQRQHRKTLTAQRTRGTNAGHPARAALEGIAHQVADLLGSMRADAGVPPQELRVDGGASRNDLLMQFQADLLGIPVVRPAVTETTALGAAYLAGLSVGFWKNAEEIAGQRRIDRRFEPEASASQVEGLREGWRAALERAKGWEKGGA